MGAGRREALERVPEALDRGAGLIAARSVVEQDPHRRRLLERGEGGRVVRLLLDRVVWQVDAVDAHDALVDGRHQGLLARAELGFLLGDEEL